MLHDFIGRYIKGVNRKYHLPKRSSLNSEARCFHRSSPRSLQIFENTDHVTEIGTLRSATSLPPCGVRSDSSTSGMGIRRYASHSAICCLLGWSKERISYFRYRWFSLVQRRENALKNMVWSSNNGSVNPEHTAVGDWLCMPRSSVKGAHEKRTWVSETSFALKPETCQSPPRQSSSGQMV